MGFFDDTNSSGEPRKSMFDAFLKVSESNRPKVHFLEPNSNKPENNFWRHYLPMALRKSGKRGIPIYCPGKTKCPVCQRNESLGDRDHPDYIRSQRRIITNVLDVTMVRKCHLCDTVNATTTCTYCGEDLSGVSLAPLNEIKLFEAPKTVFDRLGTLEAAVTRPYDPDDTSLDPEVFDYSLVSPGDEIPWGITRIPVTLVSTKDSSNRTTITAVNGQVNPDFNWRDYQDDLLDPRDHILWLEFDEIQRLLDGGSLSEVLKARANSSESAL